MYDINHLRRQLADKPKQLELLELIHKQVAKNPTKQELTIIIARKAYSSSLIKKIIGMMNYKIPYKKIQTDEVTIIKN